MVEKINIDGKLNALIIKNGTNVEQSTFFSPEDLFFQASIFKRNKGFIEEPHYHKKIIRKVDRVEQLLFILSGEMKVMFYNGKHELKKSRTIKRGDVLLLVEGIHSLKIIKDCKAISVKQGPFLGDKEDKVLINK